MSREEKLIKFLWREGKYTKELIELYEEVPGDENMVLLRLKFGEKYLSFKSENFFEAPEKLRQYLEGKQIQIVCNGAALNVYPSAMILSMGVGRFAYKLNLGRQAGTEDLVDIFDCDEDFKFVTIIEQLNFYKDWLKSL